MKVITTADIRKDPSNWSGQKLVKKMKQGRDGKVDKFFVLTEVDEAFFSECAELEGVSLVEWMRDKDKI